jgi:O-methyltransferase
MPRYLDYVTRLPRYGRLWRRWKDRTMQARKRFNANLYLVESHLERHPGLAGGYVECGCWRGGMSFALAEAKTRLGEFALFDSFAGLPPAGERDGDAARQQATTSLLHDNNRADYADVAAAAARLPARIAIHRGWFEDTLPAFAPAEPIAVLRMDGDWYDSTLCILENLWRHLAPEALVIVDDYYDWDGCARALHDFLSRHARTERIQQSWTGGVAHLVVRPQSR